MDRRSRRWLLVLLLFFGVSIFCYRSLGGESLKNAVWLGNTKGPNQNTVEHGLDIRGLEPANGTLGFGAIIAVSRQQSPRREGLLLAANITELDITIPVQPQWTEDDVNALRATKESKITRGSALAWLGHLNALRWFLSTDLETVLILEDDVDWDIHLRTSQIPAAAAAVRKVTSSPTSPPSHLAYNLAQKNYWGAANTWDILYLGHCGDIFPASSLPSSAPYIIYPDPTVPQRREIHPYTSSFLEDLSIPPASRLIHPSISPLCTFGFALTRAAAHRLLHETAARESDGGTMAYDVRVLEACRDLGFRCWSANPELFHHMEAPSEISLVNEGKASAEDDGSEGRVGDDGRKAGADDHGRLKPLRVGSTPNIKCGTRSKSFFTRDKETMEYLREEVGRKGKCLKRFEA